MNQPQNRPIVTASVVLYNTEEESIKKILSSFLSSKLISRLYLVDNSERRLPHIDDFYDERVVYKKSERNTGYGSGHNSIIKSAVEYGSKYHIVSNPDISFESDMIAKILPFLEKNPEVGLLSPKITDDDGELQYLCKLFPTPTNLIFRRFLRFASFMEKIDRLYEMRFADYDNILYPAFVSGCFMVFRTEALQDINGFDERFFLYMEDTDICRKILQYGYEIIYNPSMTVRHVHGKGSYKSSKMLMYHMLSAIKYFNKWGWFFDSFRRETNKKIIIYNGGKKL